MNLIDFMCLRIVFDAGFLLVIDSALKYVGQFTDRGGQIHQIDTTNNIYKIF